LHLSPVEAAVFKGDLPVALAHAVHPVTLVNSPYAEGKRVTIK
jgi:hypothetical protein